MAQRKLHALSAVEVRKLRVPAYYGDGGGLYLQISPAGTKSWIFRYTEKLTAKRREMGLGSVQTLGLAEARDQSALYRSQLLNGLDPLAVRDAERRAQQLDEARSITFADVAKQYIDSHRSGWANAKHADQWSSTVATYCGPVLGHVPIADINTELVLKCIEPIWSTKTETATRVRGRIEAILAYAKSRGLRTGENPAQWRGHLDQALPKPSKVAAVEHHAALPFAEIGGFMQALRLREGIAARAMEFAILTAARSGEVRGATWEEFDLVARTWTIPAAKMKAKREHRVPLSKRAIAVLRGMEAFRRGACVFPSSIMNKPLSDMTLSAVLRRMDRDDITVHGFRSSFRDWAAEETDFSGEVIEMSLAHAIGNKVEAAYRRGDLFEKRRELMTDWAKYCTARSGQGNPE